MVFGRTSISILEQCDPLLQRIAHRALSYQVYDFSVICGYRSPAEQLILFNAGRTKLDGYSKKSKHNYNPSRAMDLCPWPPEVNGLNVWEDPQRFAVLAGIVLAAAKEEYLQIRWGGDWDGDGNNRDSTLHDMPHFELV